MGDAPQLGMRPIVPAIVTVAVALWPHDATADCVRNDRPVVMAASEALRTGDFGPIAMWVRRSEEPALQAAFRKARVVRELGDDARQLADEHFAAVAVRLHDLPCTAGTVTPGPVVATAIDRALATGEDAELVELVLARVRVNLQARLRDVFARASYRRGDVDGGRAYVARYRALEQYVVGLYTLAGIEPAPIAEPIRHEP